MNESQVTAAQSLLAAGNWAEARAAFEAALESEVTAASLHGMAEALWWCGEIQESVTLYQRAYLAYRDESNPIGCAWVAIFLCITYKNCLGNPATAAGWLSRAESAGADYEPLPGWFLAIRGYLEADRDLLEARLLVERGLDYALEKHVIDLELMARADLGVILIRLGEVERGLRLVDESMAGVSAGEHTRLDTVVFVSCIMLHACELASDFRRASQWSHVTESFLTSYGCPFLYADCRAMYGAILVANGRWQEAEQELLSAIRLTAGTYPPVHALAVSSLADLRLRQGRVEEAEALLTPISHEVVAALPLAECRLVHGEHAAAGALLQRALRVLGEGEIDSIRAMELLITTELAAGEIKRAEAMLARMRAAVSDKTWPEAIARVGLSAGRIAVAKGEAEQALSYVEEATRCFDRAGLPLEAARTRLVVAEISLKGDRELAVLEAEAAQRSFESLGASLDADRAAALLRQLGVRSRPGPRGGAALSEREQEVLHLISLGLSNPEIADRLVISRKTAAHHVSSLLAKLGVRNRSEAAAYASRTSREG